MNQPVERLVAFYNQFNAQSLSQLPNIYSNDVEFIDPVHKLKGIDAVSDYFHQVMTNVQSCDFDLAPANCLLNDGVPSAAILKWTMTYCHPKLKKGNLITLEGLTEISWQQDKINYHRDYYDLGAMIYEHTPVLGHLVRLVKKRLSDTSHD